MNPPRPDPQVIAKTWHYLLWGGVAILTVAALVYGIYWVPYLKPYESAKDVELIPGWNRIEPPAPPRPEPIGYGWVDREAGIVRIPIEEAMQILVDRLPVREGAARDMERRAERVISTGAGSGRFPKE